MAWIWKVLYYGCKERVSALNAYKDKLHSTVDVWLTNYAHLHTVLCKYSKALNLSTFCYVRSTNVNVHKFNAMRRTITKRRITVGGKWLSLFFFSRRKSGKLKSFNAVTDISTKMTVWLFCYFQRIMLPLVCFNGLIVFQLWWGLLVFTS